MPDDSIPSDVRKMSFEDALAELREIVQNLESGQGKLDDAIKAYERGAALKRHCDTKLREAEAKIEKISLSTEGGAKTTPLDVD